MPISGVRSSIPRRVRYAIRSASTIHAPCGIFPSGPWKPCSRTTPATASLCTITARERLRMVRSIGISYCGPRSSVRTWRRAYCSACGPPLISSSRRYASQSPRRMVISAIRWCRFAFMQNHNAGMRQRHFINEDVMRIVAQLVQHRPVGGRIESRGLAGEGLHLGHARERIQQRRRVIRDAALHRRQRREKRQPHGLRPGWDRRSFFVACLSAAATAGDENRSPTPHFFRVDSIGVHHLSAPAPR